MNTRLGKHTSNDQRGIPGCKARAEESCSNYLNIEKGLSAGEFLIAHNLNPVTDRDNPTTENGDAYPAVFTKCATKPFAFYLIKVATRWARFVITKNGIAYSECLILQVSGFKMADNKVTAMMSRIQSGAQAVRQALFGFTQVILANQRNLTGFGNLPIPSGSTVAVTLQTSLFKRLYTMDRLYFSASRTGNIDRLEFRQSLMTRKREQLFQN
ncbi:MAG: hypothetical protein R6U90_04975 [Thiohalophilus sp.]